MNPEVIRIALASALVGASFGLQACERQGADTPEGLRFSGNIEVVDAQLGFKTAGLLVERLLSEGETVKQGQLVARLNDSEQRDMVALRRGELSAAESMLAELLAGSRPQEIAAMEASLRSAEAERERLRLDFERSKSLRAKDVIAARDFELVEAQLRVADARVEEASQRLKLVREGARLETIQQARARVEQARAAVGLATTHLENTRLIAPLSGAVLSHNIEVGEYVAPGTPVITVGEIQRPWVRAYINQTDLGRVKLGQRVTVKTDSFPQRSYEGTIAFISSEAEFTPKTVQTTKERVTLVFRMKVDVQNGDGELKPGMPADVFAPVATRE